MWGPEVVPDMVIRPWIIGGRTNALEPSPWIYVDVYEGREKKGREEERNARRSCGWDGAVESRRKLPAVLAPPPGDTARRGRKRASRQVEVGDRLARKSMSHQFCLYAFGQCPCFQTWQQRARGESAASANCLSDQIFTPAVVAHSNVFEDAPFPAMRMCRAANSTDVRPPPYHRLHIQTSTPVRK